MPKLAKKKVYGQTRERLQPFDKYCNFPPRYEAMGRGVTRRGLGLTRGEPPEVHGGNAAAIRAASLVLALVYAATMATASAEAAATATPEVLVGNSTAQPP